MTDLIGEISWIDIARRVIRSRNRRLAAWNWIRHGWEATAVRGRYVMNRLRVGSQTQLKFGRTVLHDLKCHLRMAMARVEGAVRSPAQVVEDWRQPGADLENGVALFAHYDPDGKVNAHTRRFVRELAAAGLSVVFVTNSGRLLEEDKRFLRIYCAAILVRRNIGYDFGAWRDALETLSLPREDTWSILLVNDSTIGPFAEIQELLNTIDYQVADVWGITESWQRGYHLQSFFLSCGPVAIRSRAWHDFWRSVKPVPSKDWIVRQYEVGFTKCLSAAGLSCKALFPTAKLLNVKELAHLVAIAGADRVADPEKTAEPSEAVHAARILRAVRVGGMMLNPSADLWRQLLKVGFPFVKRELITLNPTKIADVADWRGVVELSFPDGGQPR